MASDLSNLHASGYVQILVPSTSGMADRLSEQALQLGALAVSIEDDQADGAAETPLFHDPENPTPRFWQNCRIILLLDARTPVDEFLRELTRVCQLACIPKHEIQPLPQVDWLSKNRKNQQPIRIGEKLCILPTGYPPPQKGGAWMSLDAGLAFGSGTHPSTLLCLEWLVDHIQGGETVLDYGSGSGILSIAAVKLGAGRVFAFDIDAQALLATRQNAASNKVPIHITDSMEQLTGSTNILLANILLNPLIERAFFFATLLESGGQVVLAGIYDHQIPRLKDAYTPYFKLQPPVCRDGWAMLAGIKNH